MESYKCDACAKSFTELVCYKQHEKSEKHKTKVLLMNGGISETPKPFSLDQFHSPVCMVSISGLNNFQKHVITLDHALKVQKKSGDLLSKYVSDTFELKTERNQLTEPTSSSVSAINPVAPFAECKPCRKQFSGPEPYQQHLVSAGHKKKCVSSAGMMLSDETDFGKGNEKMNNGSLCDPHSLVSERDLDTSVHDHKNKAGDQLSRNSLVENQCAFKCDICAMTFTGPVPYQQHLVSNGHKKKLNAADLSKQLATTSSISSPDSMLKDNCSDLGQSRINDLRKWYCDKCKKQCSGPIPYQAHLFSRDHSKNVRVFEVEENLRKIKELGHPAFNGKDKVDFNFPGQVTSTVDLPSEFKSKKEDSYVEFKINDLNINVKNDETKVLSDKFQMNANDLLALPNLNIIPPEKLDVTVFGPDDEILFSSPKKSRQEFLPKINEVCGDGKVHENKFFII